MSQCVPRWELDVDPPPPHPPPPPAAAAALPTAPQQVPRLVPTAGGASTERYEVAELTWENGHLALQGHGVPPRVAKPLPKFPSAAAAAPWNKLHHHHGGGGGGGHGTLEAVVDQATRPQLPEVGPSVDLLAWLGGSHPSAAAADVLVPCGPVAVAGGRKRGRAASEGSAAPGRGESALATFDTSGAGAAGDDDDDDDLCFTPTHTTTTTTTTTNTNNNSASLRSPETENNSFGRSDSVCRGRRPPQRDGVHDEYEKAARRKAGRSSRSAKKSRAAAVHNQSERKRRDRINQKMNTLQKLVPNASKTDKSSMLDEVIEYVKQLQAQVQMMNRMSGMLMPMMTMPPPPPLQMSMIANMANMAQMAQMGMGMGMMDLSSFGRPGPVGLPSPPPLLHPSAFVPVTSPSWDGSGDRLQQPSGPVVPPDPFSALLACQAAQPMGADAYNRMAALYQQLCQHNTQCNSKP